MALEGSITGSILRYLNSLPQCRAEKLKGSSSASGRADINACYRGRTLRIEVKTPDHKNRASAKQNYNLEKWEKAGAVTMVVYSKAAVEWFLDGLEDGKYGVFYYTEKNGCESWVSIPSLK